MDSATLWQLQAPLKERYRHESDSAIVTLSAIGELDGTGVACRVRTANFVSAPLQMSPEDGKGLDCFFHMPFGAGARLEIASELT